MVLYAGLNMMVQLTIDKTIEDNLSEDGSEWIALDCASLIIVLKNDASCCKLM
jgi:hypothetical protein